MKKILMLSLVAHLFVVTLNKRGSWKKVPCHTLVQKMSMASTEKVTAAFIKYIQAQNLNSEEVDGKKWCKINQSFYLSVSL